MAYITKYLKMFNIYFLKFFDTINDCLYIDKHEFKMIYEKIIYFLLKYLGWIGKTYRKYIWKYWSHGVWKIEYFYE